MNVADLYVNLGISGADKTVGSLGSVKKGLGEVKSMSLEAKAAILGAIYALERIMTTAGAAGTNLVNFGALTGLSTKELQQWRYGMIQAGGTADELDSTVKNIQKSMAQIDLGQGVPEGLAMLSQAAGGIDFSKKDDPFYMMRAFQKGIKNLGNSPQAKAVANYLANSVGLTDNFIAGSRRGKFDQSILDQAPVRSDRQSANLDKANVAINTAKMKMGMLFDQFTSAHGAQLANDILTLATALMKLANALDILVTKLHLFQALDKVVDVSAKVVEGWGLMVDDVTGKNKHKQLPSGLTAPGAHGFEPGGLRSAVPWHPTTIVHQNITHHGDAKDTNAVKNSHGLAAKHAYATRRTNAGN